MASKLKLKVKDNDGCASFAFQSLDWKTGISEISCNKAQMKTPKLNLLTLFHGWSARQIGTYIEVYQNVVYDTCLPVVEVERG